MDYYFDYVDKLDTVHKMYHDKDKYEIQDWVWNRKEDLENFIYNYIDIENTVSGQKYLLEMANRWYAIALLATSLEWEY